MINYIKYNITRSQFQFGSLFFIFAHLRFLIFVLFLIISFNAKSLSLTEGGNVYYECLGDGDISGTNKYKLHFNTYILCDFANAGFNSLEFRLINADTFFSTLELSFDSVITVPNPVFECRSIPSYACLKKFTYSTIIDLPISNDSYLFVSEFCCRNVWLTNTSSGYSMYSTEITHLAQILQNSSPTIQSFPPTILCNEYPFEFPMAEVDDEDHQLVYTLCNPIGREGGGVDAFPLPPFPLIQFHVPDYSYLYPLGQNTPFSIDANTGIMSGFTDSVGKFAVTFCISEYHNGQLLSRSIHDITLNVEDCTPDVFADISNSDEFINDDYIFNLCEETQLTIQNQSTDTNYINTLFWTFDIDNQIDTFYEWNPTITFPHSGTFTGQLLLNPGEECGDTAYIMVHVSESLQADFVIDYDTCLGGVVEFTDQSIAQGITIEDWFWDFGDSSTSELPSPQHQYLQPGTQETTLIITDENGCQDTLVKNFEWLPAPPIIVVAPSAFAGCSPLDVFFENLSSPVDSTYEVLWDFGNGNTSMDISPSYVYLTEDVYNISVKITSPIGCEIDTTFYDLINITPTPQANFGWQEEVISNLQPEVNFQNLSSQEVIAWEWSTNQQVFSEEENPVFIFQDTGYQEVTLTVFDEYNCKDSLTLLLDVIPAATYFLPNAFSPNGDGVNDIFFGKGILENIRFFEMLIYNRWGEVIFQTYNPKQGWGGINFKSGKNASQGVYNCVVKYRTSRNTFKQYQQSIVLIK
ncbi:MAG: PKD domain-containing protein [Saprospiraceae bacterium]